MRWLLCPRGWGGISLGGGRGVARGVRDAPPVPNRWSVGAQPVVTLCEKLRNRVKAFDGSPPLKPVGPASSIAKAASLVCCRSAIRPGGWGASTVSTVSSSASGGRAGASLVASALRFQCVCCVLERGVRSGLLRLRTSLEQRPRGRSGLGPRAAYGNTHGWARTRIVRVPDSSVPRARCACRVGEEARAES